ncbi:MAG: hypothetical protein Q4D37_00355 [Oscillospiraceae bacterium]|nr:hypothetical protein [Oscillospiraceae bacterium]
MNIIELIKEKYGDRCQLRPPLTKKQYEKAKKQLPAELCEILKVSNGIDETMKDPNTNQTMVIDSIIYTFSEIKNETEHYRSEFGGDGFVFADNGAGDFYVRKPDGSIALYEYSYLSESYEADSLWDFFHSLLLQLGNDNK